jgi:threonine dehydrogenase-like Zn-dependent dehydrogenase
MQALTVVAPRQAYVEEVAPPTTPGPLEVVVEVARVGLCGTDAEVFSGQMAYLLDGSATYPIRLGHERAGTVTHVGSQVDASWPGRRVTGDTQLGCGQCSRCAPGSAQTCPGRSELGLRGEYPGALAEEHVVPASCLCSLAYAVDDTGGALVEPGSNALRAVWGCDPSPGQDILVLGAGTIGLPAARFAAAAGANVQVVDSSARAVARARSNGSLSVARLEDLGAAEFSAVIDATSSPTSPELALNRVEPGGKGSISACPRSRAGSAPGP